MTTGANINTTRSAIKLPKFSHLLSNLSTQDK